MLHIEPFAYTREQYRLVIDIEAAVFDSEPTSLDEWEHDDRHRKPEYSFQRDLIRRDGTVIAFGESGQSPWAYHPQKFFCIVYVHPAHDAPDIRPAYLAHVLDALRGQDVRAITSGMLDNKPEAMRFFAEHGFEEVAREQLSALDVTIFDPARFASVVERVRASGIEMLTLRDLQARDPDWQRKLYDLDIAISADIPSTGAKHVHSFESWIEARASGPGFDPDGWFVALDGDLIVGESQGSVNHDAPDQFQNGVTGVRRSHRRRGIATALKVLLITYAQQRGVRQIVTANDSRNPMAQLNLSLGFQLQPSWVRVEKVLGERSD